MSNSDEFPIFPRIGGTANFWLPDQIDAQGILPTREGTAFPDVGDNNTPLPIRFGLEAPPDFTCLRAASAFTAHPMFINAATGVGHVTVFPEWDGALRRVPNIVRLSQRIRGVNGASDSEHEALYPSLALATAIHYLGVSKEGVHIRPGEIRL